MTTDQRVQFSSLMFWLAFLATPGLLGCLRRPSPGEGPVRVSESLPPAFSDEVDALEHAFRVVNDSSSPVRFTEVFKSCACSEASLDKMELEPGEATSLRLRADLTGRQGRFSVICHLGNDADRPWSYKLTIPLYARLATTPASQLHFGLLPVDEPAEREIVVNTYSRDVPPGEAVLTLPDDSVEMIELEDMGSVVENLPDGIIHRKSTITVRLLPRARARGGSVHLVAAYQDDGRELRENRLVRWAVASHYTLLPSRVFYGNLEKASGTVRSQVGIRRKDDRPFRIVECSTSEPAMKCSVETNVSSAAHVIVLALDSSGVERFLSGEVLIQTDDRVQPEVRIPFAAAR